MTTHHLYEHTITHCLQESHIAFSYDALLARLQKKIPEWQVDTLPMFSICKRTDDLPDLQQLAEQLRHSFKTVVVLGTGGSTLCPQTFSALRPSSLPTLYYADYIDPLEMDHLKHLLDWNKTCFIVSSKSGHTLETLTQMLWAMDNLQTAGIKFSDLGKHFVVITDPVESPLRSMGADIHATILHHETDIGGRYAAFSNVGLLPAMICGMKASELRKGAETALHHTHLPMTGAALATSFLTHDKPITVFMPYVSRLKPLSALFRQLWAESLGKKGKGGTPLIALGTLDQHSQLQLYLDGPSDKWFTLLVLQPPPAPEEARLTGHPACNYLTGHSIQDVQYASQQATIDTLSSNQRPVRVITLTSLDEQVIGALTMHFMLETFFTAKLLEVDPFDQPAVEAGKKKARHLLKVSI